MGERREERGWEDRARGPGGGLRAPSLLPSRYLREGGREDNLQVMKQRTE